MANLYSLSGSLTIQGPIALTNLFDSTNGFGILNSIGYNFNIKGTPLVDLTTSYLSYFPEDIVIQDNLHLVSINIFCEGIARSLYLNNNPSLVPNETQITVNSVPSYLDLSGFSSSELPEFPGLTFVGTFNIHDNHFLHDLDGFPDATIAALNIWGNDELVSVSGLCGPKSIFVSANISGSHLCCDAVQRVVTPLLSSSNVPLIQPKCVVGPSSPFRQPLWANCGQDNYFTCLCPSFEGPSCPSGQECRDDSSEATCVAGPCACSLDAAILAVNLVAPGLAH